jgi:hypothetical protein
MTPTNLFVGPYAATVSYMRDFDEIEEAMLTKRLIFFVNCQVGGFPNLPEIIEEDVACNVPEGCTDLDALMTSITFRVSMNHWSQPI